MSRHYHGRYDLEREVDFAFEDVPRFFERVVHV
jgi:hypothetical protein